MKGMADMRGQGYPVVYTKRARYRGAGTACKGFLVCVVVAVVVRYWYVTIPVAIALAGLGFLGARVTEKTLNAHHDRTGHPHG